jgi:predicted PurR-regulated permease PerM
VKGENVRKLGFLALFVCLFVLVARLFYPFLSILLWSGLIYVALRKPYERVSKRRDGRERKEPAKTLIAGLFALGSVVLIIVPMVLVGTAVLRQTGELAGSIAKALEENAKLVDLSPASPLGGLVYGLSGGQVDLSSFDLAAEAKSLIVQQRGRIIGLSGTLLKNAAVLAISLAFMVFTLYFFFVDGEHLTQTFISAIPIERGYTKAFLRKFRDSGKQLLIGYFLVALFQATVMFLICLLMGIKGSLVIAALTLPAAFIPMIGTGLVWMPTALGIALGGDIPRAIVYLVLSAVLVSTLDNFIRPILLHERLKIHPLLIFLAILGGLQIFGFNGIIIGPIILMLFFCALELYTQAYDSPERRAGPEE